MRKHPFSLFLSSCALFGFLLAASPARAGTPKFSCGVYEISGELRSKGSSTRGIEVYPNTRQKFLLILRHLSIEDRLKFGDKPVRATVQVYVAGQGSEARARIMKPVERITKPDALSKPFRLVEKKSCS